jgi:hypothetical protein
MSEVKTAKMILHEYRNSEDTEFGDGKYTEEMALSDLLRILLDALPKDHGLVNDGLGGNRILCDCDYCKSLADCRAALTKVMK